jgi:hypothetical protein
MIEAGRAQGRAAMSHFFQAGMDENEVSISVHLQKEIKDRRNCFKD